MALRKVVNDREIYVRIIRSNISKFSTPEIFVHFYEKKEHEGEPFMVVIGQSSITVPNDQLEFFSLAVLEESGMNHIKRSYQYLKTLPQFGDYEDA